MIKEDISALEKAKHRGKNKKSNILEVLQNLESVFTGINLHYGNAPKSESEPEKIFAERTKLRKQRSDEITKREKMKHHELFRRHFEYLSPSNMYEALNETKNLKENKTQVNTIENKKTNLIKIIESNPKNNTGKSRIKNKILDIVELILYFTKLNQSGQGIKILTPDQMLSRLPISLAQLKAGNNYEKLKHEFRQLLYSWYRSKNLQKTSIKVWLRLFKNWNNFYEQRK